MSSNDNVDSDESVVSHSSPQNKKLSHVCIFEDCQKGKRGGGDYCNKHSWLAAMPIEYSAKKLAMDKKILNTQIITIPGPMKNEIHFDKSNHDKEYETISVSEAMKNYDKESLKSIHITLVLIMYLAGLSLAFTYESRNNNWYSGCFLLFYAGFVLMVTSSKVRMQNLVFETLTVSFGLLMLKYLGEFIISNINLGWG